jgi:choline dehydrogenase-like flavoprotein
MVVLGGSSAINALATMYPSKTLFDVWAKLGNHGWNADTMTPYYKKFETFHEPAPEIKEKLSMDYLDSSLHGKEGPVQTSFPNYYLSPQKLWIDSWKKLGLRVSKDPISGQAVGAFTCPSYIDPKSATRSHAGTAYYEPVSSRSNLHLEVNAMVEKILLSKSADGSVIATGVHYKVNGISKSAHASREFILSAGAFGSPAILELSGIGDAALLATLGIDLVLSNPNVGENLQDHPMNIVSVEAIDKTDSLDSLREPERLQEAIRQYTEEKTGPFSMAFNAMTYLPLIDLLAAEDKNSLENLISSLVDSKSLKLSDAQQIQQDYILSVLLDPNDSICYFSAAPAEFFPLLAPQGINTVSMVSTLLHPLSRGSTHIQSNDPTKHPKIDPKYLSHPFDLEVFARIILLLRKIVSLQPLASRLKLDGQTNPPAGLPKTLEEAKAWAKEGTTGQYHPSGTCSMLPKELGGVVDGRLIVYGTKNLRIVDASVFPMIPKGPITSTVYAVAERAADIIREDLAAN